MATDLDEGIPELLAGFVARWRRHADPSAVHEFAERNRDAITARLRALMELRQRSRPVGPAAKSPSKGTKSKAPKPKKAPKPAKPAAPTTKYTSREYITQEEEQRRIRATQALAQSQQDLVGRVLDTFNVGSRDKLAYRGLVGGQGLERWSIEGEDGQEIAIVTTSGEDIDRLEWVDDSTPASQRDALESRLDYALGYAHASVGGDEEYEEWRSKEIRRLASHAASLGADPERTMKQEDPEYRWLAQLLRDFSVGSARNSDLAAWLDAVGLELAADRVRDYPDDTSVDMIILEIWDGITDQLGVAEAASQPDGTLLVPEDAIYKDPGGRTKGYIATWPSYTDKRERPSPEIIEVRVHPCEDDEYTCVLPEVPLGEGTRLLQLSGGRKPLSPETLRELLSRLQDFERSLRSAASKLADVGELIFWAGALLDTPRCKGASRRLAEAAVQDAKTQYEAAASQLAAGTAYEAVRLEHLASLNVARAALELAKDCAEGQQSMFG